MKALIDMEENAFDNFTIRQGANEFDDYNFKDADLSDGGDSEYDDFIKFGRKGGIFARMKKCGKELKKKKLSFKSKSGKALMKKCMKTSGKVDKKSQLLKMKKATEKIKKATKDRKIANEIKAKESLEKKGRLANPDLPITPPSTQLPPVPPTAGKSKVLLYGAIGVVALVVALYLIRR